MPGVTMLELFFDLVFVFLITQITDLITASHHWTSYAQGGLVLVLTWWMYDGYAWLANNVTPVTVGRRLPMLVAMVGFLVMAVAVPDAFGDAAWVFAFGYFLVVTIHAAQFWRHSGGARGIGDQLVLPQHPKRPGGTNIGRGRSSGRRTCRLRLGILRCRRQTSGCRGAPSSRRVTVEP